ncbi:urease subunit gamma [Streptomyces sp. x-80]|uniref:urease subunit gamma n=1 Tax=Streptomyces sp. x-80 TaxID=2789282 RepID=UPI0039809296
MTSNPAETPDARAERTLTHQQYGDRYGPTTGDRIRLGDTDLIIEIEKDLATYGEELTLGVGGVVRDGQGQSQHSREKGAVDTVLSNVVILDHWGIVKADLAIKDGRIAAIGKAGNPGIQPDVTIVVGPGTQVIDAAGAIVTAGTIASNVHVPSQPFLRALIESGVTTLIGGGSGPGTGSGLSSAVPGSWHAHRFLDAMDAAPINFLLLGSGNTSKPEGTFTDQARNGVGGFLNHDVRGAHPASIDCFLTEADRLDAAAVLVPDTMNETGHVEDTIAALKGRTCIVPDLDGYEGGHAPDLLRILNAKPNVIGGSSVTARPYCANTEVAMFDPVLSRIQRYKSNAEAVAIAESIIRKETIAAIDILHDLGAISMMTGSTVLPFTNFEIPRRTWRSADKMKKQRGPLAEDSDGNDNFRVKRYIAKYTINPAIAFGIAKHVGSVEKGKVADLVLWAPQSFGVAPVMVLKGGAAVTFAGDTPLSTDTSFVFCNKATLDSGALDPLKLRHDPLTAENTRGGISRASMIHNSATPTITVDPETYEVRADGQLLTCEPAKDHLALAQRYDPPADDSYAANARRRLERGVPLNVAEAYALIEDFVIEGARDGKTVATLMQEGATQLTRAQVIDGVADMLTEVAVVGGFPDGAHVVTVHEPIR